MNSIAPILGAGAAAGAGILALGTWMTPTIWCLFKECCNDRWVRTNFTGLEEAFRRRVFGQHLVTKVALNAVKGHVMNKSPEKALVLSFNGWTGSGKDFVSKLIAENLFKKGLKSKYVHQIIATNDFPHQRLSQTYRDQLKSWVVGNVSKCSSRSIIANCLLDICDTDPMPNHVYLALNHSHHTGSFLVCFARDALLKNHAFAIGSLKFHASSHWSMKMHQS